ncbi:similar to hypothetical protein KNAG_0C00210 [Kazachstania naganishii CBS 8797] [Maudiozyma barnettii]|uniref:DRBM domain-containing protein n=1 Tax=Maudiozyma barnettii TaxID=61262 RepID=A0A8H2VDJ0_9SACH|nr:similar to hypothetical protein KNAG_0C00210 [Kazachstania naganishii CBS 8797] [Kazachstania barnettii]CAB4253356.1 similar to hypothetical protein KNAG_0C00210 [Kazachstania naganishii CBS 8797] [Kazachstania barnettii]CAD1780904.1 similar to hypothetical protein KNAG_0C00210 [Kazachstania naganishii CBS 8797] [Kazachstania barnettii]
MGTDQIQSDKNIKHKFVKLQAACVALKDSIKTIYENSLSNEELNKLASGTNEMEKMIASSPAVLISTSLNDAKTNLNIYDLFEYYKFNSDIFDKQSFITAPEIIESDLQELVFAHKELIISERVKDNEILVHVGDYWLNALLSDILYKKFPFSNTRSFLKIKQEILNENNLSVWTSQIPLFGKFENDILADPKIKDLSEDELSHIKSDCFKSYIAALVIENNNISVNDITVWLRTVFQPLIQKTQCNHLNGLYSGNAKEQLTYFMEHNKFGLELHFETEVKTSESVSCHIYLSNTLIASGEGSDVHDAEQSAASSILHNNSIVSKYSIHPFNDEEVRNFNTGIKEAVTTPRKVEHVPSLEVSTAENMELDEDSKIEEKEVPDPLLQNEEDVRENIQVEVEIKKDMKENSDKEKGNTLTERTGEDMRALPLNNTASKTDKATLYREIGMFNHYPQYITTQLGSNDFYSSCHILNKPNSYLGGGRGTNKKIAEQCAAFEVLSTRSYKKFFKAEHSGDDDDDSIHLLTDDEEDTITEPNLSDPNSIENSKYFQSSYYLDLVLHETCDKLAMTNLYSELGKFGFQPQYETQTIDANDFYSFCLVKNTHIIIGEGRGTSKKISQQIAATAALEGEALKEFVNS